MRKCVSLLLAVLLCMSSLLVTVPVSATSSKLYEGEVRDLLDTTSDAYGALIDMDGNGIQELLVMYTKDYQWHCDVYTYAYGRAVSLLNSHPLLYAAGAPKAHIAVIDDNGNRRLIIYTQTGETGPEATRYGDLIVYSLTDATLSQQDKYTYNTAGTASRNGQSFSYAEFTTWQKNLSYLCRVSMSDNGNDRNDGVPLEQLLNRLPAVPTTKPSTATTKPSYETPSPDTPAIDETPLGEGILVFSDYPNLSVAKGREITLYAYYYKNGKRLSNRLSTQVDVEDNGCFESGGISEEDGGVAITLKALNSGTASVTFYHITGHEKATANIHVYDQVEHTYSYTNVPALASGKENRDSYLYSHNMYIDNYRYTENTDGSVDVWFDVYNTNHIYGAAISCYGDGRVYNAVPIQKMSYNNSSMKEIFIENGKRAIADLTEAIRNKKTGYRQQTGFATLTSVALKIPKNGYLAITIDPSESRFVYMLDILSILSTAGEAAGNIQSATKVSKLMADKSYATKLTKSLFAKYSKDAFEDAPKSYLRSSIDNLSKEFVFTTKSLESTVEKILDKGAHLKMDSLIIDSLIDVGFDVGENVFTSLSGLFGVCLKGMFAFGDCCELFTTVHQFTLAPSTGAILIYNQGGGLRTCRQVSVRSETLPNDVYLNVYSPESSVVINRKLERNEPTLYASLYNGTTYLYNITLIQNGQEYTENGRYSVTLELPEDMLPAAQNGTLKLYRKEPSGSLTSLPFVVENNCAVFETEHFSIYVLNAPSSLASATDNASDLSSDSSPLISVLIVVAIILTVLLSVAVILLVRSQRNHS